MWSLVGGLVGFVSPIRPTPIAQVYSAAQLRAWDIPTAQQLKDMATAVYTPGVIVRGQYITKRPTLRPTPNPSASPTLICIGCTSYNELIKEREPTPHPTYSIPVTPAEACERMCCQTLLVKVAHAIGSTRDNTLQTTEYCASASSTQQDHNFCRVWTYEQLRAVRVISGQNMHLLWLAP
jgi:hypothetical protein